MEGKGYEDGEGTNFVFLVAGAARRRERVNLRMKFVEMVARNTGRDGIVVGNELSYSSYQTNKALSGDQTARGGEDPLQKADRLPRGQRYKITHGSSE